MLGTCSCWPRATPCCHSNTSMSVATHQVITETKAPICAAAVAKQHIAPVERIPEHSVVIIWICGRSVLRVHWVLEHRASMPTVARYVGAGAKIDSERWLAPPGLFVQSERSIPRAPAGWVREITCAHDARAERLSTDHSVGPLCRLIWCP